MKKKILIGSIIAVAIIVGVSLTSVVGYQSVESNFKESPLFNVRSGRAIEKESNDVTCDYVGKGKLTNFYVQEVDVKTKNILYNAFNGVSDTTFTRFANLIIYHLQNRDKQKDISSQDILHTLKKIKDNPKILRDYNIIEFNEFPQFRTGDVFLCTIGGIWGPGCYIWEIIDTIITILLLLPVYFYTLFCNINLDC
jgi:hypothetical protein